MTGTIINVVTVLVGGTLGLLFGARLPERVRETVVGALGLFTVALGLQMFLKSENAILVLGSLLIGGILGEWWRIETRLSRLGSWLEQRFTPGEAAADPKGSRFVRGFLTASLLFCVGPMAILGSIQDGLTGDYSLLAVKSVMDGFAALAFASTFGPGVLFAALTVLLYQGGLSLGAAQLQNVVTPAMMNEMTAAGGVILLALAVSSLLEIKPLRSGNLLPALAIAPLLVALFGW
ncbi:MAG TPA: DUF554 domain-containing protein [Anaerolineae bacterium]|nr:DUF554 domain-containing protein [Anaerolineae bacterium]HID85007.1 DUF554 domain-containing protein [Anaerolineales bacterium]HIQ08685.1 DUF554 domain-containing protein [Anaerolineaceae bacterium]